MTSLCTLSREKLTSGHLNGPACSDEGGHNFFLCSPHIDLEVSVYFDYIESVVQNLFLIQCKKSIFINKKHTKVKSSTFTSTFNVF